MKVNLSELLTKKPVEEKTPAQIAKETNSREMARYDQIIRSIAGKYGRDWCLTFDEVYSELCYKILNLGVANGWENLNENLVSRICYNRAVDLFRAAKRRQDREVSETIILTKQEDEVTHSKIGTVEEAEQNLMYDEFVHQFNPESRERRYLVIKMVSEGLISERYAVELGLPVRCGSRIPDYQISEMLGLHPRSRSFGRMKKEVREEFLDYIHSNDMRLF